MAPSPPLIVFLSIVSLSVSLSCSALFLTVLLTSCTRGQLRDPLRQQGLATTDPLLSFWGAAQELQKLPPETRETPQGVSAFLDGKGESARAFGGAEGKEMRSGMAEEKFAILRDRFADWLVRSSGRKWAVGGAPSSSNPLLQTRLQDMLRARMLNGGARGDELLRGDESAIEQGRGDFVPEVGRGRKTTDNNEEHNEEDSLRGNSKGQIEPTKPFHRKVCCGRGNAEDIHNDVRGTGSSAHFKENKNKMHDARTNLATPAPLKKPFVFKADLSSRAANSLIKEAAPVDEIKTLNPAAAEGEPPRLAGLKASAGRLEPDFEWETERYDLHVRQDVKEVRFTPVLPPGQDDVSIYVSSERTANNTQSGPIRVPENARRGVAVPIILKRGAGEPQAVYVVKIFRDLEDAERYQWRLRLIAALGLGVTLVAATSFLTYSAYMWDKLRREHLRAQAAAEAEGEDEAAWLSE